MYKIIQYCLDFGSYERLNTDSYNHRNYQLFIYFQAVGTKISEVELQWQWLDRFNSATTD